MQLRAGLYCSLPPPLLRTCAEAQIPQSVVCVRKRSGETGSSPGALKLQFQISQVKSMEQLRTQKNPNLCLSLSAYPAVDIFPDLGPVMSLAQLYVTAVHQVSSPITEMQLCWGILPP